MCVHVHMCVWDRKIERKRLWERVLCAYFKPNNSAVALATKNTRAGLILFPPALKICSAADIKTGFSAPTIYQSIFIRYIKI